MANVGVIFGGRSAEHDVSIQSARYITRMLASKGHGVTLMAVDRWGRWWFDDMAEAMLEEGSRAIPRPTGTLSPQELLPPVERLQAVDILFPVLHGPYGEDGRLQGLLDVAGIPYVGSGVTASAVAMDKAMAKALFQAAAIPVLPWLTLVREEVEQWPQATVARIEGTFPYPLFVKPANLGSSIGITKVKERAELLPALHTAGTYDRRIVVEPAIPAREIEVSVLGNSHPQASVPGEVIPGKEWYDYEAKYMDERSQLVIPAPLSPDTTATVQELAVRAFRALDAAGLARVDFLLHTDTGQVYLNEVNTMPGFTQISMYPKLWEASGLPGPDLVDTLIRLGFERHAEGHRGLTEVNP
ncbi:MAG: D-alanine--D-alanine ligase [Chloroflexi bacterium]|nr:D-alanine--D-alanine ligase [Chloroflexota bacterium]